MTSSTWAEWRVPAGLILLSLVPAIAGVVRVAELTGGADITPDNARYFASPIPVLVHIPSVILYSILGAFQFAPGLRRRRPGWHRAAGWLLVPCGLATVLSGLWMTLFYPRLYGGDLLVGLRVGFGSAVVVSIVLGVAAIRRRDIARHRAWMTRAYAIAMGAGTQLFTNLPWFLIAGKPGDTTRALLMGAGWVINLAVAEWIIRRRPAPRSRPVRASAGVLAAR